LNFFTNVGKGVLWYYDENGKFVLGVKSKRGVRLGCVLGMFLFCITMRPIYA
jgi:hypothetical protein